MTLYIKKYSSRPAEDIDLPTLCALRLGLYQLIYCSKIPHHAAINETVELCPKRTRGFVNAILRSHIRSKEDALPRKDGSAEYLSAVYSVCLPLAKKLIDEFGFDDAESFLEATFSSPSTTLRVNTLRTSRDELLEKLPEDKRSAAIGVLSHDPRPSYQRRPGRVYGISFAGVDIRFTVEDSNLTVIDVI